MKLLRYFSSCFLLMIPVMVWNIVMSEKLPDNYQPDTFQKEIHVFIIYGESFFRFLLFLLSTLMPLSFQSKQQKIGISIYVLGVLLYFCSWFVLIRVPNDVWSNSIWGFMAPAYTPALWLIGISLIGDRFFFGIQNSRLYFILTAFCFLLFHNLHTWIIYTRLIHQ